MSSKRLTRFVYLGVLFDVVPIHQYEQDVAMILLQILDEGSLTDSQGRKVDFKVCRSSR